jgi:uncharacterized protein YjbI with pentapeptide repeats
MMANPEHVEIVKAGAEEFNKWREENSETMLDLSGANLRSGRFSEMRLAPANLEGAVLVHSDFRKCDLRGVNFQRADMKSVDLQNAELRRASLYGADLDSANLREANLRYAILHFARFVEADLSSAILQKTVLYETVLFRSTLNGADFSGAACSDSLFGDLDLSQVFGLATVEHAGPSTIGLDTVFRSKGKIPEVFLRGCGVPEIMIEYMQSLAFDENPIQYYKCFISYTEADNDFSERLHNDLKAKSVRCWRWREDAKIGRSLIGEVDQAIRVYDKLMVILSESSLNSEPVIREIERALQKESREGKEVLFPIRVDDAIFKWDHPLQADVVRKVIGDFTNWKEPTPYNKALDRLIECLQAESPAKAAG